MDPSHIICLLLIFLAFSAGVAAAEDVCHSPSIHRIERPYYSEHPNTSAKFEYAYKVIREAAPGYLTVIFIPGGPGQTAFDVPQIASFYPKTFGVVALDPRGLGCNAAPKGVIYPIDFYSSINLASDTLAVVNDLRVSRYVLHGASYGSVVATIAAGLAEKSEAPRPTAVVMEGVLGRAYKPMEIFSEYVRQWDLTWNNLPQDVKAAMRNDQEPMGIGKAQWGNWITYTLLFRTTKPSSVTKNKIKDPNFIALSALLPSSEKKQRETLTGQIKQIVEDVLHVDQEAARMYQAIMCHEIATQVLSPNMDVDLELKDGRLIPKPTHLCDGIPMDQKFDATDWKTTAPIYYFVGGKDPSTPTNQGIYNFKAQTEAKRNFVLVPEGSHCALVTSLADCNESIWTAINADGEGLETALKSCQFGTKLEIVGPGKYRKKDKPPF